MPKQTFLNLSEEKKNRIVEKCYDLFIDLPYEEITIREIVKSVGISIGSFYKYFDDKEDLYLYLMVKIEKKYLRKQKECYGQTFLQVKTLPVEFAYTPRENAFNKTWYKVPMEVQHRFYFGSYADELHDRCYEELLEMKDLGMLRKDLDLDLIYYFYRTGMFNMHIYFRQKGIKSDEERLRLKDAYFRDILFYGIMDTNK